MTIYRRYCEVCNNVFETNIKTKQTCSSACSFDKRKKYLKEYHRKQRSSIKICIVCGKEFEAIHNKINTCSDECKVNKKRTIDKKHYDYRLKNTYTKTCINCGNIFQTTKNQINICSKNCMRIDEDHVLINAVCPGCGVMHKKNILKTAVGSVTPRYFCNRYPYCMKSGSSVITFVDVFEHENRASL